MTALGPVTIAWLILVHFGAASVLAVITAVLQATDRMSQYGLSLFGEKLLVLLGLLLLIVSGSVTPMRVLACYAAASLAVAAMALVPARRFGAGGRCGQARFACRSP